MYTLILLFALFIKIKSTISHINAITNKYHGIPMLFTVFVTNSILSSKNTKTNGINTPIEQPAILAFLLFIPFKSSILFDVSFDLIALSIALFNATTFELLLLIYFFSSFIVISFGLSDSLLPPNIDLDLFLQTVIKKFNIIISSLLRLTLFVS